MSEELQVLDEQTPAVKEISMFEAWANALVIRTPDDRKAAYAKTAGIKRAKAWIVDFFKPEKSAADALHAQICAKEKAYTSRCDNAEKTAKGKMTAYDDEQEAIRLKEESRLQAIKDAEAAREKERLLKRAETLKTPELKEEARRQAEEVVAPVIHLASTIEKQAGESTKQLWGAELISKTDLLLAAADGNALAASFLAFDEKVANAFARSTRGAVQCPGVKFTSRPSLAVGTK